MTKKKSLQDTHHTPSHKIIPQTESDELSQGNSQKKNLNPKDIELEEKNKEEKVDENTLMFEQKNISVPKLYCHLARQTEKILLLSLSKTNRKNIIDIRNYWFTRFRSFWSFND